MEIVDLQSSGAPVVCEAVQQAGEQRQAISQDSGEVLCLSALACGDLAYEKYAHFIQAQRIFLSRLGFDPFVKPATPATDERGDSVDPPSDSQATQLSDGAQEHSQDS